MDDGDGIAQQKQQVAESSASVPSDAAEEVIAEKTAERMAELRSMRAHKVELPGITTASDAVPKAAAAPADVSENPSKATLVSSKLNITHTISCTNVWQP